MANKVQMFLWSDGWWIEEDEAWFVDGMSNTLFDVDLNTGECDTVKRIPELAECTFRLNPICIKCDRDIFCIPGIGKRIWVYNLDDDVFTEVEIDKSEQHQLGSRVWNLGDAIFIVGANWNKIIEVSICEKAIKNYYMICANDCIGESIFVNGKIYSVSSRYSRVYQFDVLTKKVDTYSLPNIEKRIFTMCFDGEKFWLSGYHNEIYIWDKEENKLTTIDSFPDDFNNCGLADNINQASEYAMNSYASPVFKYSIAVGGHIWFIPVESDKIIYINKKTAALSVFELCKEDIAKSNVWGIANYLLEYVRNDRYIGLFSAKNSRILEIDTEQLSYQWKEYYFSDKCVQQYYKDCKGIHYEDGVVLYSQAYRFGLQATGYKANSMEIANVGTKIHEKLIGEDI